MLEKGSDIKIKSKLKSILKIFTAYKIYTIFVLKIKVFNAYIIYFATTILKFLNIKQIIKYI